MERDLIREMDENNTKLSLCKLHSFRKITHKIDRYKCIYCGGEVNGSFVKGYNQGLEHNDISDIISK